MISPQSRLPDTPDLRVQGSRFVSGELGVFARRAFGKHELMFKVEGPARSRQSKYSFAVDVDKHIEPQREDGVSDFGHYLNHSCDPNVLVRVETAEDGSYFIDVVARRAIGMGEELAFDYASLEYDVTARNVRCQCAANICRGVLHGFKDLPPNILENYTQEGMISHYLLKLSANLSPATNQLR